MTSRATGGPARHTKTTPAPEPEAAPAAPEDDGADSGVDEATGKAWARFTFLHRDVRLLEPSLGQRFILMQTVGVNDEGADTQEKLELVLGFAQMLRALFVDPAARQWVTGAIARDQAELEDYFGLAKEMAEHWDVEDELAPATQAERRAAERRPVRATAKPRR